MPTPISISIARNAEDLKALFSEGTGLLFQIHPPQRRFKWKTGHVKQLWDDIRTAHTTPNAKARDSYYFLGTLLLAGKADGEHERTVSVIDGQQRITTLSLLLAVLRDLCIEYSDEGQDNDGEMRFRAHKLQDLISRVGSDGKPLDPLVVTLQEPDNETYLELVRDFRSTAPWPAQAGLLASALTTLKSGVIEHIDESHNRKESLCRLCDYVQERITLLPIEVRDEVEGYLVFDTTNTRGRHLSPSESLKARLAVTAAKDRNLSGEFIKQWNAVETKLENAKQPIDAMVDYVHAIWTSEHGYTTKQTLDKTVASSLTAGTGTDQLKKIRSFINDLKAYCDSYLAVVAPEGEDGIHLDLKDLNDLKVQQAISFLTMVHKHSRGRFEEAVSLVLTFQVRNITIGGQGPNAYQEHWPEWAKDARHEHPEKAFAEIRGRIVDDKSFRRAFEHKTVAPRTARPLLRKLDGEIKPVAGVKHSSVHVEHIVPRSVVSTLLKQRSRTRKNVQRWIEDLGEHIPSATDEKRKLGKRLETLVNMLGNQALLYHKANGIATDAPFIEKRELYRCQASELTKSLVENSVWGPKEIIARQKMLAERAPRIWRK